MQKTINWGIIGCGKIAAKFAEDLATLPDAKLVAVASTSEQRAQSFASKHHAQFAFDAYEKLFSLAALDAVYIATPHTAHMACTLLALDHKVAVLCEKPFGMDKNQVLSMVEKARNHKLFLMEALWTRFLPSTLKALALVNAGAIGQIKTIHADFGFKAAFEPEKRLYNKALGGGALLDIGIYPAFMSLLFLGFPSKIQAVKTSSSTDVDETTSFVYQYHNDATAVLNCTIAADTPTEAVIYGTEGYIKIPRFYHAKSLELYQNNMEVQYFDFNRATWGYNYEISEVNQCIRDGMTESKLWSLEHSLQLISLLDQTREAAEINYKI